MKRSAVAHNKTKYLRTLLKRPMFHVLGILESLWQFTARDFPRGNVGKINNARIASEIEWDGDPDELINALEMAGFLDPHSEHRLVVHDWPHHCEDSIHCYLARRFERFADGSVPKFTRLTTLEKKGIVEKWEKILAGEKVVIPQQASLFPENTDENKSTYFAHTSTEVQTMPSASAIASAKNSLSPKVAPVQKQTESERVSSSIQTELPENLNIPEFIELWRIFEQHCADKDWKHTRAQKLIQLKTLSGHGVSIAMAILNETMRKGFCTPIKPEELPKQKAREPTPIDNERANQLKVRQSELDREILEAQKRANGK